MSRTRAVAALLTWLLCDICLAATPQSDVSAQGLGALEAGDHASALAIWQRGSSQGDAWSRLHLARMYLRGTGVPHNRARAMLFLNLAANQGLEEAVVERERLLARIKENKSEPAVARTGTKSAVRTPARPRESPMQPQRRTAECPGDAKAVGGGKDRESVRRDGVAVTLETWSTVRGGINQFFFKIHNPNSHAVEGGLSLSGGFEVEKVPGRERISPAQVDPTPTVELALPPREALTLRVWKPDGPAVPKIREDDRLRYPDLDCRVYFVPSVNVQWLAAVAASADAPAVTPGASRAEDEVAQPAFVALAQRKEATGWVNPDVEYQQTLQGAFRRISGRDTAALLIDGEQVVLCDWGKTARVESGRFDRSRNAIVLNAYPDLVFKVEPLPEGLELSVKGRSARYAREGDWTAAVREATIDCAEAS